MKKTLKDYRKEIQAEYKFAKRNKLVLGEGHRDLFRIYKKLGGKLTYTQIVKGLR